MRLVPFLVVGDRHRRNASGFVSVSSVGSKVRGRKSSWERKDRRVWRALLKAARKPHLLSSKYQVVRPVKGLRDYNSG